MGGEGLVNLEQVPVLERGAGLREELLEGHLGRLEQPEWLGSGAGVAEHLRQGLHAIGVDCLGPGHHQRRCAVREARGVAGGHRAAGREGWLELGQHLDCRVGARALVGVDNARGALATGHRDGHDLRLKAALLSGGHRALVAAGRALVLLLAADPPFLRDRLGAHAHVVVVPG